MANFTSIYESPLGTLVMTSNGVSLMQLDLAKANIEYETTNALSVFDEAKRWLDIYFSGTKPNFYPQIELHGTAFQKKVWGEILKIDFGQAVSYGELARRLCCRSSQAVGQAVSRNPILIMVPCHRIIAADGKIGGFSAGIDKKVWLLKHEGQVIGG